MKSKKILSLGIVCSLLLTVFLSGCGKSPSETQEKVETVQEMETAESGGSNIAETVTVSTEEKVLAQEIMKKYSAGAVEYDGKVFKVDRTEPIVLDLGYDPWSMDMDIEEAFAVYQDAELKYRVDIGGYEYDNETGKLTITPPYYGIGELESSELDLSHLKGNYLAENDENSWGTLGRYYLASYVDAENGKVLDKPVITVIQINAELTSPQMVFSPTDDGYACFTWQEVQGADGYLLFKINKDETGYWEIASAYADVKENKWSGQNEDMVSEYGFGVLEANSRFVQFFISDDSQSWMEENAEELLIYDDDTAYNEYWDEYYGMIAYNSTGCSSMSNLMSAKDLAHMLPSKPAVHANEEAYLETKGTQNMPAVMNVTMCDGTTAQKVMDYDFESIVKEEENNFFVISAKGLKTPFVREIHVFDVNWDTFDADIEIVKERQEKLKNKGGNVAPSLTIDENVTDEKPEIEQKEPEQEKESEQKKTAEEQEKKADVDEPSEEDSSPADSHIKKIEVQVTANSALSEYIAYQMLDTKGAIDISAFPEAADTEKVVDAFFEAQYQNPLVLGVQGGSIDTEKRILYVEYDFDKGVTAQKQEEIKQRVEEIIKEIITDDMSDAQKGNAINKWLCENAVYDNDALANAELYSFTRVDEEFYDSFTAYGILLDGVGVCASYSAAYKLLADAAGIDSVVVTGYLDGSVPHAWNKVMLDDKWYIVDATNNDNDMIENALLNLSDAEAGSTLVEDDRFVMDGHVDDYMAKETKEEYYRATQRYFDREEISKELADLLVSDGKAVLRTRYDIDDEIFYEIAQEAANKAQKSVNGFYWMGVINLQE